MTSTVHAPATAQERATEATTVRSVYVHAPFCARRCGYCDFAVTVRREGGAREWVEAIGAELDHLSHEGLFELADRLDTLYVGGGTPSLLGAGAMASLAARLGHDRLSDPSLEWTVEANPESFDEALARDWRAAGVGRVSLGAQTFHEGALRWMGRLHGPDGPERAVRAARAAGLTNLSVDLIFGLPARVGRDWRSDLERVVAFDVPHVSLYGLTVEAGTPLGRAVAEGRESPVDEAAYEEEFLTAVDVLGAAGYEQYEVSNFARPGARSRHNSAYWTEAPYLGLGNGAHGYAPPVRRWNVRDWEAYRAAVLSTGTAEEGREIVDAEAAQLERVWLSLRTAEGLVLPAEQEVARALAAEWEERGLATLRGGAARLSPRGWLVLDRLAVEMDAAWLPLDR